MPIMIEEMQAEVRPEPDESAQETPAATTLPTPDVLATISAQLRHELRVQEEHRQRWQAD